MEGAPEVTHPGKVALDFTKDLGAASGSSKVQPVHIIQYLVVDSTLEWLLCIG